MATTKKIIVTINDVGVTRVEAEGFAGEGCVRALGPIADALVGKKPVHEAYTSDFYRREASHAERERA